VRREGRAISVDLVVLGVYVAAAAAGFVVVTRGRLGTRAADAAG
jgi:hypothetical protein